MTSLIESFRLATPLRRWTLALFLSCPAWGLADHPTVSKPLVIGSELDFPPFALVREGGAPDGFTVELWRAVASAAHLNGTIKTGPFHEILDQFKNGQVDVLINLAISDQRRGFADFSLRHVKMFGAVFTRKGDDRIKSEADLAGKSLIAVKADLAHDYANMRGWYNLALVDTVAEGMKLLAGSSRHDAMLVGRLVGLNTTKDLRLAGVQALPLKLGFQQEFAFAVRKGNAQLLAQINDGLANVHASGAYETIYAKWFAGLEPQPLSMETLLDYLVPAIAVILLLALVYCRERGLRLRWKQSASSLQLSIAEREQAELDLRASEARFTAFMDHSPAIAFIKDGGGRYVYVNKTWENIYALDWRGKTDVELWPREDAEMFSESDRRALEAGQASESFETVLDKDGRPQDWWVMKFPIVDAAGRRLLGGVALDVTERKRAEIALRESEARLRTIIDTEPECVKVVAPDGRLVDMNAVGLSMLQADSLADLADKSLIDFVQPDYRPAFIDLHRKVMGGESATLEFEITGLRGRQRWLETHAAPLRDAGGEVIALLGVTQDITDRKATETDRARLAAIVENSGDAIISRDLDFRVLTWNRAAERMFGYGAEEVIGRKTNDFFIPADRLAEVAEKCELMARGESVISYDTVRLGRNGRPVDVSLTQSPIRDASGRVTGVSLVMRDVSARKRAEWREQSRREILEQLARGATLPTLLSSIVALVEQEAPDASCSVLLLDESGKRLRHGAGPRLPAFYNAAVDGLEIGPAVGSCGRAAFTGRRVIVEDIETHPLWIKGRELALAAGLRSCWSEPILSSSKQVLGTFAIYHPVVKGPSRAELEAIGIAANLASIAIERKRAEEALGAARDELERRVEERTAEIIRTNKLLKESEERLRHALTVGKMGTWERDLATGAEEWDHRTYEIFGIAPGTAVDLETFISRIHPDDLCAVREAVQLTERTGAAYDCDYRVIKPDGKLVWIHATGGLRRAANGTPTHIAGISFDITERKQAEEALRESEARLRAILDHSPAPVFIKDTAGRYVHVNSQFEKLFGVPGAESVGKTDAELFGAAQAHAFQSNDRRVLELGQAIQFEEVALYRDGEYTSIVNKFPLRDSQGNIYGLCGIATDITARKAAEEALRKLNEELDQRVALRTRELAESQGRLRALVAEITKTEERERRRLAVELHDYLAQMLTVSRFNISRAGKLAVDAELKKRLADAQHSVDDSIAYTRSLMAQLSPRVLYELGLPAALNWLAAEMLERHGLSVEVAGESDGVRLDEDRSVLAFQCVRELVWNIVKHAQTNSASLSYEIQRGGLSIEIADEGQGFDAETLDGGGVEKFGLFSVRERLELLGGRLEVTSRPGGGTIVRFNLPARPIEIASAITERALPPLATMAKEKLVSVALVDDHEVVRRGLRQVLEECADLTVVGEAKDGVEGVELARQFRPDVVVMDVNMPRMNGIEATRLITQEMPSTIVVGLSFDSGEQVRQAMKASGASTCITKERAVEDIHQAIIDAVEERRTSTMDNG